MEKPILFSEKMVKAILGRYKNQTRRVIKLEDHDEWEAIYQDGGKNWIAWSDDRVDLEDFTKLAYPNGEGFKCPYGQPGDALWVRETWKTEQRFDDIKPSDLTIFSNIYYPADDSSSVANIGYAFGKTRPLIYMPRWASRITLRVEDVRVERIQDISDGDAKREGIRWSEAFPEGYVSGVPGDNRGYGSSYFAFRALWDSINAKRGYGWDVNPWVWVVEFSVMEA